VGAEDRQKAIEFLARELHWKMETLDPVDGGDWDRLEDADREFYRQCVKWILAYPDQITAALSKMPTTT
jgi:hypothetical protein